MSLIVGPVTAASAASLLNAGGGSHAEATPGADVAKQQGALNALVRSYTATLYHDEGSPTLARLARQIAAAAAELGQVVTLPQMLSTSGVQDVAQPSDTSTEHVDLQA